MRTLKIMCMIMMVSLLFQGIGYAWEADNQDEDRDEGQDVSGVTPPRLSFVDGQISFWRSGAPDWTQAQVNMPLAAGDQLYAGSPGNLEIQIGARAFVRAGASTQLGLENLEADAVQFKVTEGHASVDIHEGDDFRTVEIDTPNATFLIEEPGYYKVHVGDDATSFSVYWSGKATVTPAEGDSFVVSTDETVRLQGTENPKIRTVRASEPDQWDQWCLSRSEQLLNSRSSKYLSPDVYGASDLDQAGDWEETAEYGAVWIPRSLPNGWAPYTNGSWVNDPVYGWTWVDNEPWGWVPYHYGRWLSLNGRWAWAPGPPVRRPAYAPALVAFFGDQEETRSSEPAVAWVPLSWGEPLVPWWGPKHFHRPWWGGWGGPRHRHIERTGGYRNMEVRNAMVAVHQNRFGHGPIKSVRVNHIDPHRLRPLPTIPVASRGVVGFLPTEKRGIRPPDAIVERTVVSTREPRRHIELTSPGKQFLGPTGRALPPPRIVNAPQSRSIQKRVDVQQTQPGDMPTFPGNVHRNLTTPPPVPNNDFKVQHQQQIHQQQIQQQQIQQQQIREQQIQQQQLRDQQQIRQQQIQQQQIQQQQIQQQQIKEQQIHQQQIRQQQIQQQQIQQQQIQQQQIKEQQIHQQQIQQQQIQQQQFLHQQQVKEQQIRQQQLRDQQIRQQQQAQQQQIQQQQQVKQQQIQQQNAQQHHPKGKPQDAQQVLQPQQIQQQ